MSRELFQSNNYRLDLDHYMQAGEDRIDLSQFPWGEVREHELSERTARILRYMMDIESYTPIFKRDLLATQAAYDPRISAFLSKWEYQEYWHGEAFSRLLGEAGYKMEPDAEGVKGNSPYPTRVGRNEWIRRQVGRKGLISHFGTLVGSALYGEDFPAVHMAWGAVNELSTLTAYSILIEENEHSFLNKLLQRIIKDERVHFAFYRYQARERLKKSKRARRITRWALEHLWAPVGTGVRPQKETDFVVTELFGKGKGL
ncbi:ferritin-like domain-containing protein [Candidatus Roizmanbacteria bacterium]|nr:ferritin-like domain-containing protein [Candidatus Roizmanbacteria bacterium]